MENNCKIMSCNEVVSECDVMKYLPLSLKKEYDYISNSNPDVEELKHPYINVSDVLRGYFILIHFFTDDSTEEEQEKMLVGLRSGDLLTSALSRQIVAFAGKIKYTDALDICSTLFFGLVKNHAFSDGNKRTALLILLYQLFLFGYIPIAPEAEFEKLVVAVAANRIHIVYNKQYKKFKKMEDPTIKTLSFLLRRMVKKKDHTYHASPTMREFCTALERLGVECVQENSKMHFYFVATFLIFKKRMCYAIPFNGWTRTVGPQVARNTLSALELYDQYPSYQDLLDGHEPLYELIDRFKVPLRRLKDE